MGGCANKGGQERMWQAGGTHSAEADLSSVRGTSLAIRAPPPPPPRKQPSTVTGQIKNSPTQAVFSGTQNFRASSDFATITTNPSSYHWSDWPLSKFLQHKLDISLIKFCIETSLILTSSCFKFKDVKFCNSRHGKSSVASFSATLPISSRECS